MFARMLLAVTALGSVAPASAQQPASTLEQQMLLRCSAAFAIVASDQQRGGAEAAAYPPLGQRGREYFVQAGARLMDELHLTREQLAAQLREEVSGLQAGAAESANPAGYLAGVMGPCLISLDAAGL